MRKYELDGVWMDLSCAFSGQYLLSYRNLFTLTHINNRLLTLTAKKVSEGLNIEMILMAIPHKIFISKPTSSHLPACYIHIHAEMNNFGQTILKCSDHYTKTSFYFSLEWANDKNAVTCTHTVYRIHQTSIIQTRIYSKVCYKMK